MIIPKKIKIKINKKKFFMVFVRTNNHLRPRPIVSPHCHTVCKLCRLYGTVYMRYYQMLHYDSVADELGPVYMETGSPFFDGRATLLAGSTFLLINTLARLAGSTPSRRDNQGMLECCWLEQRGQRFSHKRSLNLTRLGG